SSRLKNNPVCLVAEDGISIEMEKYLSRLPDSENPKATKILEINPNHDIFKVLQKAYSSDEQTLSTYSNLLYQQALLIEGMNIEDPVGFSNEICKLMEIASKS
ncbi:MAG: molecular chaperone HtpG, partial [Erysipelotrichaceae bacterium]|nr:molecular chaperone HtpG [Erysipelotrichaceae bacterium]